MKSALRTIALVLACCFACEEPADAPTPSTVTSPDGGQNSDGASEPDIVGAADAADGSSSPDAGSDATAPPTDSSTNDAGMAELPRSQDVPVDSPGPDGSSTTDAWDAASSIDTGPAEDATNADSAASHDDGSTKDAVAPSDEGNSPEADGATGCVPDCEGKVCGPDGCGDSCGTCPTGELCDPFGQCVDSICGNGQQEGSETCDPPQSCPSACAPLDACTPQALIGAASTCTAECIPNTIEACVDGDGCCPSGCDQTSDNDCEATCGNGVVEQGESCDPPGSCPSSCSAANACTVAVLQGSASTCDAECVSEPITLCASTADGCCPLACDATTDADCDNVCGDGALGGNETCDPPGSCPTTCDDGDACTTDTLVGSPQSCTAECVYQAVTACTADGCCAPGCHALNDPDCEPACDNGVVEPGETCDPIESCPTSCDDGVACSADTLTGSPELCTAECSSSPITACVGGDGCCPESCTSTSDGDCAEPVCGNGIIESGETCDPKPSCPKKCNDNDPCTVDVLNGSFQTCTSECSYIPVACLDGDGCCSPGCDASTDNDCPNVCGNGVIEPGETCDPPGSCPLDCDDGDACTDDVLVGSVDTCTARCESSPLACSGGDGCCPAGCHANNDSDCSPECGNDVIEQGETCDPPETCPQQCDDFNACTTDGLSGDPQSCGSACTFDPILSCTDGDGCCPEGCDTSSDSDCGSTCANAACGEADGCCPTGCDITNDGDCPLDCTDPSTWPALWAQWEDEVLYWSNVARSTSAVCGNESFPAAPPLGFDPLLQEAARCHTLDMAINDFMSHTGSNGSSMTDRINATGYNWFTIGENVAAGYNSPQSVVDGWMNSPGHCSNIMNSAFEELGCGYVSNANSTYFHYWTQNFGTSF